MNKISKFATESIKKLIPYKSASQEIWDEKTEVNLKLDWNEGVVEVPDKIIEPFLKFLSAGNLRYYPNVNNVSLIKALEEFTGIGNEHLTYFSGIDSGHEYIAKAFLGKGEKVLMLTPTYDNFRAVCEASEAIVQKLNYFNTKKTFSSFKTNAKIVYFANPNNPTGEYISEEIITQFLKKNKNTLFVIDEAYIEFGGETCAHLVADYENILICRTLSKAFCLAGIRFGYFIGHQKLISAIDSLKNPKSVSMFSQIIAETALRNKDYMLENVEKTNAAKKILKNIIQENIDNVEVQGDLGNFLLIKFHDDETRLSLINNLKEAGIYIRSTSHLVENSCRITVPPLDKLKPIESFFGTKK